MWKRPHFACSSCPCWLEVEELSTRSGVARGSCSRRCQTLHIGSTGVLSRNTKVDFVRRFAPTMQRSSLLLRPASSCVPQSALRESAFCSGSRRTPRRRADLQSGPAGVVEVGSSVLAGNLPYAGRGCEGPRRRPCKVFARSRACRPIAVKPCFPGRSPTRARERGPLLRGVTMGMGAAPIGPRVHQFFSSRGPIFGSATVKSDGQARPQGELRR